MSKAHQTKAKRLAGKIMIICVWFGIWEALALAIHSKLIMAGPVETVRALLQMAGTRAFYTSILFSACRVLAGFLTALLLAVVLAALSYRYTLIREFLHPFFLLARSIPVASFVILALLWMGSKNLAVLIVVLVALPILYSQLLAGLQNVEQKYKELAEVFRFRFWTRVCTVYVPAVREQFLASCRLAVGMSFKAGIAAEVIAGTRGSIGEQLYLAKLYFSTGELFAWTAVIVALSWGCEKLTMLLCRMLFKCLTGEIRDGRRRRRSALGNEAVYMAGADESQESLSLTHVTKSYDGRTVFSDVSIYAQAPELVVLAGPSGTGKTTLLYILAGLCVPDGGEVTVPKEKTMVFQDIRLFEHLSAVSNVVYAMGNGFLQRNAAEAAASQALRELLPEECLWKPVKNLSGGERRRVELVRAMLAGGQMILLDEPFTGMDEKTREQAMAFLRRHQMNRLVVLSVHEAKLTEALMPEKIFTLKAQAIKINTENDETVRSQ